MGESKSAWIVSCSHSGGTNWGEIKSWTGISGTTVKMISMKENTKTSFKFNTLKDEMLICIAGEVKAYYGDSNIIRKQKGDLSINILCQGQALIVQSECPYRLEAVKDSIIIEVSSGTEGVVRLLDDYGRKTEDLDNNKNLRLLINRKHVN